MRDKYRDESYFKDTVEYNKERIKITLTNAESLEIIDQESKIKTRINLVLNRYYFDLIKSMYSVGESYEEISKVANRYMETTCEYWTENCGFETLLNTMSIAVIFNASGKTLERLKGLLTVGQEGKVLNDVVINELIRYLDSSWDQKDGKISNKWIEGSLVKIIDSERINHSKLLEKYVGGWYAIQNGNTYYRTHENGNENYAGYWSFEAAAFAVIFGIDDSGLKDTQYYPYDLVRGHRNMKLKDMS